MHKLKYFFRNISLVNIMLIAAVIILANYIILPMLNMSVKYTPSLGKKTIVADKDEKPAEIHIDTPSPSDYTMIAENNLFHPERKIPVEKKEEKPLPKPDIVLYGTLITDDISLAYLEDLKAPYSTPGRGKRQTALRKGDTMSGFTLKGVEADKIVMVRGDEQMTVYVRDPQRPKPRGAAGSQAAQPPPPTAVSPLSKLPSSEPAIRNAPLKQKDEEVLNLLDSYLRKKK
jgi:hypothetical protein